MKKSRMFKFLTVLLILISVYNGPGQSETQDRPCRRQPNLVDQCFYVRGRLSMYNGNPTYRLWRAGTRRILGVSDSFAEAGYTTIPAEMTSQLNWENELWGNFLVCPFTRPRSGVMQMICIESAKNLVVRKRQLK
jgi:hypothetical protein